MKVVITGGLGFLGLRLARALLDRGTLTGASGEQEPIEELILFDAAVPEQAPAGLGPMTVRRCARSSRAIRSRSSTSPRW